MKDGKRTAQRTAGVITVKIKSKKVTTTTKVTVIPSILSCVCGFILVF
jgi:hypothetical protein